MPANMCHTVFSSILEIDEAGFSLKTAAFSNKLSLAELAGKLPSIESDSFAQNVHCIEKKHIFFKKANQKNATLQNFSG